MATSQFDEDSREQFQSETAELAKSEEFRTRLAGIAKSRLWKHMTEFLCLRREQLFNEKISGADERAFRDGALSEVQKLLRRGPQLVLEYELYREKQQPRSQTSELPSEPLISPTNDDGLG